MLPNTYHRGDGLGVRMDTLVDARMEVNNAQHQLRDINVTLDGLADDREGIWTDGERAEIRQLQKTVQHLLEVAEENDSDIKQEMNKVRDRL